MKHLWPLLLAVACVSGAEEVKVKISVGGKHVGFGTIYYGFDADGGFREVADYRLQYGDSPQVRVWAQHSYTKDGVLNDQIERMSTVKGLLEAIHITYSAKGAHIEKVKGRERLEQDLPWPEQQLGLWKRPFWFMKGSPALGTEMTGLMLDTEKLEWRKASYKYEAVEKLQLGREVVRAHKIRNFNATEWWDSKGMPYRLDIPMNGQMMTIERL